MRSKSTCAATSWYPKISDAIGTLTLLNSTEVNEEGEEDIVKTPDIDMWTGGGEIPANCTLPRVYIKTVGRCRLTL